MKLTSLPRLVWSEGGEHQQPHDRDPRLFVTHFMTFSWPSTNPLSKTISLPESVTMDAGRSESGRKGLVRRRLGGIDSESVHIG